MGNKSNLPIGVNTPRRGDRVKASDIANLATMAKRLASRGSENYATAFPLVVLPFDPSVRIKTGSTVPYEYQISASLGVVIEKVSSAADGVDALLYWTPSNALTDDVPTWFDVDDGQSLFVVVTETDSGTVRTIASVALEVASSTTISTAYIPSVQDGIYYYEIAKFTIENDSPVIERVTAGSHIFHEVTNTGWWGTVNWDFFVNITDSTPYEKLQHKYEAGIVVEVKYQGPGGSLTTIAGTQDAPATVTLTTFATP